MGERTITGWATGELGQKLSGLSLTDGVTTQGAFKDYFDGKFDGANDAIRKSFPDKVKSKVPPGMMAIPEVATHRCSIGGTIRIVDPGQRSNRAKLGGASMKP